MRHIKYLLIVAMLLWLVGCGAPTATTDTNAALGAIQTGAQPAAQAEAGPSGLPEPSLPALSAVQPDAEQQAAMQDPEQVARLFAESIKQQRFAAVEPLMNDEVRARLALNSSGDSVAAFYQDQQAALGKLVEYTIFNKHTVYDSDDLVAFDLDFKHERQLSQGKILLAKGAQGWQIAGVEDRAGPSLGEVAPSEAQRQAMQAEQPTEVARLFAEQLKQQQYDQLEPLFTYFARQTFGQPGSIAEHYRDSARRYGTLLDYSIGEAQTQPDGLVEISVTLIQEQASLPSKVVVKKTPQGWKISRVVAQQS